MIALGMDVASLQLHRGLLHSRSAEKAEIMRRRVVLLLYLLRSPFYDSYTKYIHEHNNTEMCNSYFTLFLDRHILVDFLKWLSATIPLLHFIVGEFILEN